ncbi:MULTISPECIES: acyltransferase family protein [Nitrosomonas]|uniref:Peptidoglycan/LPS O-acetylase OafA/YrhL n=1 Tax=Nitrosomonas communis TaxID=44574 RepID=A0A5D3YA24_9PROT|nr:MULTISPECIES: acyltransferase [Nitrosomonas]TYP83857.1 peptidoglycan/LPS O-acetylase OafA/YrhL [Nitrosomonas communis]UVS62965.1 acyltransferase [Nitrosomonas sp. PLL12]
MIHTLKKDEIRSHTALRGWAALMVVLVHFRSFLHPSIDPDEVTFFFAKGYLWVDFFFILSGFVLSYVYGIERPERRTFPEVTHYLIARFARIYPLHFVSLIAVCLFFITGALINWGWGGGFCCVFEDDLRSPESLMANLFLIHAWGMFDFETWNRPSWSLSVEFFCYLGFAALLVMEGRGRKLVLLAWSCTAMLFYCFYLGTSSDVDENFRLSIIRAASAFLIGIMLFLKRETMSTVSDRWLTIIQITAGIMLLLALHFGITDVVSIGLMAVIVLITWEDRGFLCKWLATRPLYTIGVFSFSIYMWHYLIKFAAQKDWESYTGLALQSSAAGSLLLITCMITLVIPIAIWSHRLLEIPARRWITSQLNGLVEARYMPKCA